MSRRVIGWARELLLVGLAGWGVFAGWQLWQARRAGAALRDMLTSSWSEEGGPRRSAREELLAAADEMRSGRFGSAARLLARPEPLSTAQKAAAQRFFAKAPVSRQRFIAAVSAVERRAGDEGAVRSLRLDLQRALKAAASGDAAAVDVQLRLAETELKDLDSPSGEFAAGPEGILARVQRVGPALSLGHDLLTEGDAAVEKLVARASWHFKAKQYPDAARLLDLAAQLIGEEGPVPTSAPVWFLKMAQAPAAAVDKGRAEAALKLCEAVTATEAPGRVVGGLVERARIELDAGRPAESYWWATVAMSALGMTEEAVAAAVVPVERPRQ